MTDDNTPTPAMEDKLHEGLLVPDPQVKQGFQAKFGRPPTRDVLWRFDPGAATPQAYPRWVVRAGTAASCDVMEQHAAEAEYHAEIWNEIVSATKRTGLVMDQYIHLAASVADRLAYDMAVQEWFDGFYGSDSLLRLPSRRPIRSRERAA